MASKSFCLPPCRARENAGSLPSLGDSLVAQLVENLPAMQETWVQSLGWEDLLEKEMATHSSILAWEIPWSQSGYSPWGHKELDTTEQLSFLSLLPLVIRTYQTYRSVVSDSLQPHGL